MESEDAFGTYHPGINFLMFAAAIVLGMCFRHPAFMAISVVLSATYYLTVKGARGIKVVLGMIPVFVALTVINPLFNTYGETVLFTYLGGRPYSLEALFYGMVTGAMFVTILLWFASYNAIMTSDKFTYLFGSVAPSVSLVLTMVLRLVPNYQRKAHQLAIARSTVGKSAADGTFSEKVDHGMQLLSVLTTWAFENGVIVADSMRSRGYGLKGRTAYSLYRFEARDRMLLAIMVVLMAVSLVPAFAGCMYAEFTPTVNIAGFSPLLCLGLAAYFLFLALPSIINIRESLIWRISLSRI